MNDRANAPSAAESAQTALQMLAVLEIDVSGLVTLARETVEESVMPDGAYAKASELYRNSLGLLWKVHNMVAAMRPEIETVAGIVAQVERDLNGTTTH